MYGKPPYTEFGAIMPTPIPSNRRGTKREPKTERIEVRVAPMVKKAIQRATAISGLAVGDLAYVGARSVLDDHERMVLRGADQAAFLRAIQRPSRPNRRLVNALRRHKELVEK
jgi:uncharacterized protein (DUF1778 family)